MTVDHIAWLLFPGYAKGALPVVMHIIGRLTCPIMCYFIAEGYYHTRNIRKYTFRLFLFAVISHFAYSFASNDFVDARSLIPFYFGGILNQTSVMWPLAWGLVMLRVANSERFTQLQKTLLVVLICLVSFPSDWSCIASLCVLAFGTNRGDLKAQGRWMLFLWRSTRSCISSRSTGSTAFCSWPLRCPCRCWPATTASAEKCPCQQLPQMVLLSLLSPAPDDSRRDPVFWVTQNRNRLHPRMWL